METSARSVRRRSVKGFKGIYETDTVADGVLYEIGYVDSEKRWRWLLIGSSLQEAMDAREELSCARS